MKKKKGDELLKLLAEAQVAAEMNTVKDVILVAEARKKGIINQPVHYGFDPATTDSVIDTLSMLFVEAINLPIKYAIKEAGQLVFGAAIDEKIRKNDYVLYQFGVHWMIKYAGEIVVIPHMKGLDYIARLINKPYGKIKVDEFIDYKIDPETNSYNNECIETEDEDAIDTLDAEKKDKWWDDIKKTSDEPMPEFESKKDYDPYRKVFLHIKKRGTENDLREFFKKLKGSGLTTQAIKMIANGRWKPKKRYTTQSNKNRSRVTMDINRVYKALDSLPAMKKHLKNSIKTGTFLRYNPTPPSPIWYIFTNK